MVDIKKYISENLAKGHSREEITTTLVREGYEKDVIDKIADETRKPVNKEAFSKLSIYILFAAGFLVLVIIVFFIFNWVGGNLVKERTNQLSNRTDFNTNQTNSTYDYVLPAVRDKNISECNTLGDKFEIFDCQIGVSAVLNNSNFCLGDLENLTHSESLTIRGNRYSLSINSKDYCWLRMSIGLRANYCSRINDLDAKAACSDYLNYMNSIGK